MAERESKHGGASAGRTPALGLILRTAAFVYIAWTVYYWGFVRPAGFIGNDFHKHWLAARCLFEGTNNYVGEWLDLGFNYPQATVFIFGWLGFFSREFSEKLWEWMHIGFLIGCWAIAWKAFAPSVVATPSAGDEANGARIRRACASHWGLLTAFVLCLFTPATHCIWVGNVDPYNALLAMGLAAALLAGRDRLAGVLWALLILCKMLPLALIIPFFIWRRWRIFQTTLAVMAVYFIVLVATGRLGFEWYFVREAIPNITFYWRGISVSVARGLIFLLGLDAWHESQAHFNAVVRVTSLVLVTFYVLMIVWLRRRRGIGFERVLELAMLFYPIMAPLLEPHHFVFMMPVMFLHMKRAVEGRMLESIRALYLLFWLLLGQSYTVVDLTSSPSGVVIFLPLLAALGLLGTALAETVIDVRTARGRLESGSEKHAREAGLA